MSVVRRKPNGPGSTRTWGTGLRAGLLLATVIGVWPAGVQAQPACTFTQITNSTAGASSEPSISSDGTRVAFVSTSDLTGGNPAGRFEIFLFDAATNKLTQITYSATGGSSEPSISAAGARIAFVSNSDLTGGNADANNEIFLFDTNTQTLTQITSSTAGGSSRPSINADGTRIAFESTSDLTGGNADGNGQIFLVDTTTNTFTQITHSALGLGANGSPSISAAGTAIAFQSTADLTGGNADGSGEIFLVDTTTNTFTQITNASACASGAPSIDADGRRIAFVSTCNLTGGNAVGADEIFLFDKNTSTLTQLTHSTSPAPTLAPSLNAAGTRVAFASPSDLTGGNPDGNDEIFLFNININTLTQVTDTTKGGSVGPSINADGTRIAFQSDRDLTGGNADGNDEIFLAKCAAATVVIGGCDSGVPNVPVPGGGTITDRINQCAAGSKNHGVFVSCVTHLTNDLKKAGIITGAQKGAIERCAGKADIP